MSVIAWMALTVGSIPIFVMAGVARISGGGVNHSLFIVALALTLMGALIWLTLRFSLSLPMTFAEQKFRLFESWKLTKGQTGKMFLVYAIVALTVLIAEVLCIASVVAFAMIGAPAGDLEGFFARQSPFGLAAWIGGGAIAVSVITVLEHTVFAAPLAVIYRHLITTGAEEVA